MPLEFGKVVKKKFSYNKEMYAGLVYEGAFNYEKEYITKNKIRYSTAKIWKKLMKK